MGLQKKCPQAIALYIIELLNRQNVPEKKRVNVLPTDWCGLPVGDQSSAFCFIHSPNSQGSYMTLAGNW